MNTKPTVNIKPTCVRETMNSADPQSENTAEKVQQGNTTTSPDEGSVGPIPRSAGRN